MVNCIIGRQIENSPKRVTKEIQQDDILLHRHLFINQLYRVHTLRSTLNG